MCVLCEPKYVHSSIPGVYIETNLWCCKPDYMPGYHIYGPQSPNFSYPTTSPKINFWQKFNILSDSFLWDISIETNKIVKYWKLIIFNYVYDSLTIVLGWLYLYRGFRKIIWWVYIKAIFLIPIYILSKIEVIALLIMSFCFRI